MASSNENLSSSGDIDLPKREINGIEANTSSTDEEKEGQTDVTITVTSVGTPTPATKLESRRKLSGSYRHSDGGSSPIPPNYGRGRRASGARLGSEERVRKISFGIGGVPKSGSYGGVPVDDDSDLEDSLLIISARRQSSFILGPTLMGYNRRQWLNLLVFAIVDFCSAAVISLQAPFYPPEAISRGATGATYAAVFFAYELTVFIMFPVFGKLFGNTSSKTLFNVGVFITSISLIMFGFLTEVSDLPSFITVSFILRVIEGVGYAAFTTAKYSIISFEFPQNAATTFASLEKFYFLGCIIAPIVGGFIIEGAGEGKLLPFSIFGLFLCGSGFFTSFVMPAPEPEANEIIVASQQTLGGKIAEFWPVIRIPSVLLGFLSVFAASCSIGFLNVNLEPHIHKWDFSAPVVASIFILSSGLYSISASIWAWFREKINNSLYIMLMGSILIWFGFLLIGPAPMIPLPESTWVTCLGLLIHGIGLGASIVSGYMLALHDTIENGFADNVTTFGLISAIFTSVFSFGQMLGCSTAGILQDQVGFRWGICFILGFQLLLVFIIIVFIIMDACKEKKKVFSVAVEEELDPLLRSSQESRLSNEDTIHEGQIYNPELLYKRYSDLR